MFLAFEGWGLGGEDFIARAERVAKNNAENEPFFLILGLCGAVCGSIPSAVGTALIDLFLIARCAHNAVYLAGASSLSVIRPPAYIAGFAMSIYMSVLALKKN